MADNKTLHALSLHMVSTLPTWGVWASSLRDVETPHGKMGYRQISILWTLRFKLVPESEQSTTGLAAHIGVQNSVITRACEHLEKLELVKRQTHPTDRRRSTIHITEKGIEASEYVQKLYVDAISDVISELDEETIAELERSTRVLADVINKLRFAPPGS